MAIGYIDLYNFQFLISLQAREWICAENKDGNFISTYARDYPDREDITESVVPWLAVTYRSSRMDQAKVDTVKKTIPNRISYLTGKISIIFPR